MWRVNGTALDGQIENISIGGMLIVADELLLDGEKVWAGFTLPGSKERITVEGQCRWTKGTYRGAIGLAFIDLPAKAGELIIQFVDAP